MTNNFITLSKENKLQISSIFHNLFPNDINIEKRRKEFLQMCQSHYAMTFPVLIAYLPYRSIHISIISANAVYSNINNLLAFQGLFHRNRLIFFDKVHVLG